MPPDTRSYLHAAYAVAAVVYGVYIVSLLWRARKVKEQLRKRG
ncbi:MAG TPA: hypothetical protein VFW98_10960 [Gemmatimonadaceae bacterium]|nr:hypothetical protein [Gemmatimonadaceae bacterium]